MLYRRIAFGSGVWFTLGSEPGLRGSFENGSEDETMFYVTLTFFSGQYKTWTADCGLRTEHKKYGLGKKRGLENTDWVQNTD